MTKKSIVSKNEAMELLSKQMRRPEIDDATLVKLVTLYSKLNRWGEEPTPSTEPDMDALVAALERKRRESK